MGVGMAARDLSKRPSRQSTEDRFFRYRFRLTKPPAFLPRRSAQPAPVADSLFFSRPVALLPPQHTLAAEALEPVVPAPAWHGKQQRQWVQAVGEGEISS
jgi:hypothetical protein